jgi:hypothetical protein
VNLEQREILTGLMLGDGYLERRNKAYNTVLKVTRCARDIDYQEWLKIKLYSLCPKHRKYSTFDSRTRKRYYSVVIKTVSMKELNEFHEKWYIDGKKIVPRDILFTPNVVKVWFADDGSVSPPKDKLNMLRFDLKFATHGFSKADVCFLKDRLDNLFGVSSRIYHEAGYDEDYGYTIRILRTDDCRKFLRAIDDGFPLQRKADIWRNPTYRLFEDIHESPKCVYCGSDGV